MKKPVPIPEKLWKVMRITFSQALLILLCTSLATAHSIHAQEVLNRTISIQGEKLALKDVLNQIEKEAQVK